jgi:hypothetical protein
MKTCRPHTLPNHPKPKKKAQALVRQLCGYTMFHVKEHKIKNEVYLKKAKLQPIDTLVLHECPCIASPEENVHSYGHVHFDILIRV